MWSSDTSRLRFGEAKGLCGRDSMIADGAAEQVAVDYEFSVPAKEMMKVSEM